VGELPRRRVGLHDPDAQDHRLRWGHSPFQQPRPRMVDLPAHKVEAARANRRDVITSNKAWHAVRRDWLAQLAARKTAPKGTACCWP